jgi:hypothetical protein
VAAYIVIMQKKPNLKSLSDDELLRRLSELLRDSRRVEADLVAHIAEVDARRAYARKAASSMFVYCTEVLHLSAFEAYLRIAVARASREHPILLTMLRDGRLHLSAIAKLAPHLTPKNRDAVLERAVHKSKRQIEELVAELAPRPDAPARMRKLPAPRQKMGPMSADAPGPDSANALRLQLGPDQVVRSAPLPRTRPAGMEAVAPARHKIEFTADDELRHMLERLQSLMRSSVPDGDLGEVIRVAVSEKLERLEAKRFARTKAPRKSVAQSDTTPKSRYIPAAIRRAVHERDKGRCTYEDARGKRCTARDRLEFHHHDVPYGKKGDHSVKNVRMLCRSHNQLLAELEYGKEKMARYRRSGNRVSEPQPPCRAHPHHSGGFAQPGNGPTSSL